MDNNKSKDSSNESCSDTKKIVHSVGGITRNRLHLVPISPYESGTKESASSKGILLPSNSGLIDELDVHNNNDSMSLSAIKRLKKESVEDEKIENEIPSTFDRAARPTTTTTTTTNLINSIKTLIFPRQPIKFLSSSYSSSSHESSTSSVAFPSTSTLSEQDEQEETVVMAPSSISFHDNLNQIGLSLMENKEMDNDQEHHNNNNNNNNLHPLSPTTRTSIDEHEYDLLPRLKASRISFLSEVTTQTSMDASTVETTTTAASSSSSSFTSKSQPSHFGMVKFVVEMVLIQILVVAVTLWIYHQSTHKLTLRFNEEGEKAIYHNIPPLPNNNTTPMDVVDRNITHPDNNHHYNNIKGQYHNDDCIYVPGGGFSGFWFTLGRLSALEADQIYQEKFVCYSAGCLGVVATLLQRLQQEQQQQQHHLEQQSWTLMNGATSTTKLNTTTAALKEPTSVGHEELYDMARAIQVEWLEGSLHRYDVVEAFIDRMMESLTTLRQHDDNHHDPKSGSEMTAESTLYQRFLYTIQHNLFIVTTQPTSMTGDKHQDLTHGSLIFWQATLQRPQDETSLKRMLLQTTWIPLAVGASITHHGHLDGAFSVWQHPTCRRDVGLVVPKRRQSFHTDDNNNKNDDDSLPVSTLHSYWNLLSDCWKLWSNTLNVNLGKKHVDALFQMGLDHGV